MTPITYRYPLADAKFTPEEKAAVLEVLDSGRVTQGARVEAFERAFVEFIGAKRRACFVNSGSSANLILAQALRDFGRQGGEVVMPALTWATSVAPFVQFGFKPVFVDVGPDLQMDPSEVASVEKDNLAAVLAVHLCGGMADVLRLKQLAGDADAHFFEDACEALGAKRRAVAAGATATFSSFSFYQSHHLSTIEGGMVLFPEHYSDVLAYREHGWIRNFQPDVKAHLMRKHPSLDPRWMFAALGFNVRNTEIAAALGLLRLPNVAADKVRRQQIARVYEQELAGVEVDLPSVLWRRDGSPNPFSFPVLIRRATAASRIRVSDFMERGGVETRPVMSGDIRQHPWYRQNQGAYRSFGSLPWTRLIHESGLLLPCHAGLSDEDVAYIASVLKQALKEVG